MRVSDAGLTDTADGGRRIGELGLEGMVFHAFHGCFEQERQEGATYRVDLTVRLDMSRAVESDALEDTVDVQRLYDIVAAQMAIPRNLIEAVAGAILSGVRALPGILEAEVTVRKCAPPLSGDDEGRTPVCEASFVRLKG
ncbi:MAG: dihydroneopterin aldolase [Bacteroidales bacterium]|nr:dihydroneopterin aldolase [Bacteroidales bacterium]